MKILVKGRGKHFDPRVVDAFLRRTEEAIQIMEEYMDYGEHDYVAQESNEPTD